jgi:hypothetical protein
MQIDHLARAPLLRGAAPEIPGRKQKSHSGAHWSRRFLTIPASPSSWPFRLHLANCATVFTSRRSVSSSKSKGSSLYLVHGRSHSKADLGARSVICSSHGVTTTRDVVHRPGTLNAQLVSARHEAKLATPVSLVKRAIALCKGLTLFAKPLFSQQVGCRNIVRPSCGVPWDAQMERSIEILGELVT